MTKQHKALELADELKAKLQNDVIRLWAAEAAITIRRQHALIVQMREALEQIADFRPLTFAECADAEAVIGIAEIALAAATQYLEQP